MAASGHSDGVRSHTHWSFTFSFFLFFLSFSHLFSFLSPPPLGNFGIEETEGRRLPKFLRAGGRGVVGGAFVMEATFNHSSRCPRQRAGMRPLGEARLGRPSTNRAKPASIPRWPKTGSAERSEVQRRPTSKTTPPTLPQTEPTARTPHRGPSAHHACPLRRSVRPPSPGCDRPSRPSTDGGRRR